ncbi:phosphatase PAP2 family protein [Streptomyces kroppenstedtii]|uniref:phosphatase PAP2 family protein n=1 Tax=Streptomyces kroppenstedtii TaxID=3051181 RepID=UPI0028D16226|nr:phosphatase PAP2 family protein [Streptomyces sp. DSM 40484]
MGGSVRDEPHLVVCPDARWRKSVVDGVAERPGLRWAAWVSGVFEPPHWMVVLPPYLGWRVAGSVGVWWGLGAGLLAGVVPAAFLAAGSWRRWWGRGLRVRQDRLVAIPGLLLLLSGAVAVLYGAGAPREVAAVVAAMVAVVVVGSAVTSVWKVSAHSAVTAAATAVLVIACRPHAAAAGVLLVLVLGAAVVAVAWSRVRLDCHTRAQVVVGAALGLVLGGAVFAGLR